MCLIDILVAIACIVAADSTCHPTALQVSFVFAESIPMSKLSGILAGRFKNLSKG
jgi:hypothetical protein